MKEDIEFTTGLADLLDIMKNSAVFQFRALQSKKKRFDEFFEMLKGFFSLIGDRGRGHVLMSPSSDREAAIIMTSDEGFMGDLNSQIVRLASTRKGFKEAELLVVGERGARYLKDIGREFTLFKSPVDIDQRRELASALADHMIRGVKEERFGRVSVSYPRCVSFMLQKPETVEILPLKTGTEKEDNAVSRQSLIVESPIDGIIEYLAEELAGQKLIDLLEDSKLSEFAARAIHLEKSSQDLAEKEKKIRLQYFRVHHELIDKSTRELFSAQVIIRRNR